MKKFRHVLSFIVATALIMSMSTLCFLVSAEGEGTTRATNATYTLDVNVEEGDTNGQFTLGMGGALNPSPAGGATSSRYSNPANGEYPIDIIEFTSFIYFTAPVDGSYTFNVDLEKGPVADTSAVSHYSSIVFHVRNGQQVANSGWGIFTNAGTTAKHSKTWDLLAGDLLVLQVGPESDCTTQGADMAVAVKDFTVKLGGGAEHVCSQFAKATCQSPAVCVECGEPDPNSQPDPSNHTSEAFVDNGDGTHRYVYDCCGTVITESENHTYLPIGQCVQCGAKKPAETEPSVETTEAEQEENKDDSTFVIIVVVVVAVVVIAGVVTVIVINKKKAK